MEDNETATGASGGKDAWQRGLRQDSRDGLRGGDKTLTPVPSSPPPAVLGWQARGRQATRGSRKREAVLGAALPSL